MNQQDPRDERGAMDQPSQRRDEPDVQDISQDEQLWLRQALASVAAADRADEDAADGVPPPPTLDALLASVRTQARADSSVDARAAAQAESQTPVDELASRRHGGSGGPTAQGTGGRGEGPVARTAWAEPGHGGATVAASGADQVRRRRWHRVGQWGMAAAGVVLLAVVVGTMIRTAAPTGSDTSAGSMNGAIATTSQTEVAGGAADAEKAQSGGAGAASAAAGGQADAAGDSGVAAAPAPTEAATASATPPGLGAAPQRETLAQASAGAPSSGAQGAAGSGAAGSAGAAAAATEMCSWRALPTSVDGAADTAFGKGVVSGSRPLTAPCQPGQVGGAVLPAADGSRAAVVVEVLSGHPDCTPQGCRPAGENRYTAPAGAGGELRAWVNTRTSQVIVSAPPALGLSSDQLLAFAESVGDQVG